MLAVQFSFTEIQFVNLVKFTVFFSCAGIPTDWCMENVAKLLKLCGESVCHEVLGNKAINGRIHEISYLGYYLGQVRRLLESQLAKLKNKDQYKFIYESL